MNRKIPYPSGNSCSDRSCVCDELIVVVVAVVVVVVVVVAVAVEGGLLLSVGGRFICI